MEKAISKTKLKRRLQKKTNPMLAATLREAIKHPHWMEVGKTISSSTRRQASKNLFEIDAQTKVGDTVVIIGRVLSEGWLTKRIRICALSISDAARKKVYDSKSEILSIFGEIQKNPMAEGIKVLK